MHPKTRRITFSLPLLLLFVLLVKLFFFEFSVPGDPTIGIAIKVQPSFQSYDFYDLSGSNVLMILWMDELTYHGRSFFHWYFDFGWMMCICVITVFWLFRSRGLHHH